MKLFFHESERKAAEYNSKLLKKLVKTAGHLIESTPAESDYIMVSVCDVTELSEIEKARQYGKPIITGGSIAFMDIVRLLSDYVCPGEAYEYVKTIGDHAAMKAAEDKIDSRIDFAINPVVKVTNTSYYYYISKGCPVRCKYCLLSYTREYSCVEKWRLEAVARSIPAGKKLLPIASHIPYSMELDNIGTADVMMKDYNCNRVKTGKEVRTGLEFFDEGLRRDLAKGQTDDMITTFIQKTKTDRVKAELFIIAGLETTGSIIERLEHILPEETEITPTIGLHPTYIDPQPMTPFQWYDIRQKISVDWKKVFYTALSMNKRIRLTSVADIKRSTIRTLKQRSKTMEQYQLIKQCEKKEISNTEILQVFDKYHSVMLGNESIEDIRKRPRKI